MKRKIDKNRYSKFMIYLVVVILLNMAGITLFFRMDMTSGKVYSLSEASRKAVSTLSEPLTVKVFFNSNLPAPYNNIERYLHDLLEEYAIAGGRYFNYRFYNVSGEEDEESGRNQELAESYGIYPVQIQNIEEDEVKFQKAYMGMALLHGDVMEAIPTITSTDGLEYRITSAIRKMNNKISALLRLKEKVSVKLVLSSSLRAVGPYMNITGLLKLPSEIENIVNRLNNKNYGKLSFVHIDPSINPDDEKEAERLDVLKLNWDEFRDRSGNTISADRGYAGIIVEYGGRSESIDLIEVIRIPIFGTQYQLVDLAVLEESINETVEDVININEEIGYLTGHGTVKKSPAPAIFGGGHGDSIASLNKLLNEEYTVKDVNLKEGSIPEGLSFLMIAGAKEEFSDYELYQIDQFLMKGKSLAIFMDAFKEVRPQAGNSMMMQYQRPYYVPVDTGLEKLLNHYGLNLKKSIVLDENSYKEKIHRAFGGGQRRIYYAPIIKNELINKEAEYLRNIKGLIMLRASPVSVDEQKIMEHNLKATKLFSSSERSWEMKERFNPDPVFMRPPKDEEDFRSFALAYVVEGAFPSYFADRPVPVKEEERAEDGDTGKEMKEGEQERSGIDMSEIRSEGETIKKGKPGKIFLIGTSEILKDNVIDEDGRTPNAQFIMNVIDYLNGREDIAVMRSKTQTFNPLKEVAPGTRTAIKTTNIAGLPVLVIACGLIVWLRRSSRKRLIRKIFSKP
jgi:ABC-type uncharacterized transport system involved in gliding motility auxiliary subunit